MRARELQVWGVLRLMSVVVVVAAGWFVASTATASAATPPLQVGVVPAPDTSLYGVSCPADNLCFAVGAITLIGASGPQSTGLILRWDGSSWTKSFSLPDTVSLLNAISCTSTTFCLAVGHDGAGSASTEALRWNGSSWSKVLSASPSSGGEGDDLYGVDCLSAVDCWAVGGTNIDDVGGPAAGPLVENFDGLLLNQVSVPVVAGALMSVGCPDAESCYAVPDNGPSLEQLQGSSWQLASAPGPQESVTCRTSDACWVLGQATPDAGPQPLAAYELAGGAFVSAPTNTTTFEPIGSDCSSSSDCWTVGMSTTGDFPNLTFTPTAEQWDGSQWAAASTSSAYDGEAELTAVSCTPDGRCLAVGRSLLDATTNSVYAIIGAAPTTSPAQPAPPTTSSPLPAAPPTQPKGPSQPSRSHKRPARKSGSRKRSHGRRRDRHHDRR